MCLRDNGNICSKGQTQVITALSPPISCWPGDFGRTSPGGRVASLSAKAMLYGKSSRISTYSSTWILFNSFGGWHDAAGELERH